MGFWRKMNLRTPRSVNSQVKIEFVLNTFVCDCTVMWKSICALDFSNVNFITFRARKLIFLENVIP